MIGLVSEAGAPVLQAALDDGPGKPLLLATVPTEPQKDVIGMRLQIDGRTPGVWLGYVPQGLGQGPAGAAGSAEDPLQVAKAAAAGLGFSPQAAFGDVARGYHKLAGLQTAVIGVQNQGETFTIRLAQERGGKRWYVWSVYLGSGGKMSPQFIED